MKSGDRVTLRQITPEQARRLADEYRAQRGGTLSGHVRAMTFCEEHNDYEVDHRDEVGDVLLRCVPCMNEGRARAFWACPVWVVGKAPRVEAVRCSCAWPSLRLHGCRCGAMEEEQRARGLERNRWTKLWEPAR